MPRYATGDCHIALIKTGEGAEAPTLLTALTYSPLAGHGALGRHSHSTCRSHSVRCCNAAACMARVGGGITANGEMAVKGRSSGEVRPSAAARMPALQHLVPGVLSPDCRRRQLSAMPRAQHAVASPFMVGLWCTAVRHPDLGVLASPCKTESKTVPRHYVSLRLQDTVIDFRTNCGAKVEKGLATPQACCSWWCDSNMS